VDLASTGARSRGNVFGSQLLFESRGECGDLLGGPFGDSRRGRREGVYRVGIVAMLITWPVELLAMRHSEGLVSTYIGILAHHFGGVCCV
jgi:hypothetical protein